MPPIAWDVAKGLLSFWGKQGRMTVRTVHLEGRSDQQPSYAVLLFFVLAEDKDGVSDSQTLAGETEKTREMSSSSCLLHLSVTLTSAVSIRGTVRVEASDVPLNTLEDLAATTEGVTVPTAVSWQPPHPFWLSFQGLQLCLIPGQKRKCWRSLALPLPFLWMLSGSPGYHLAPCTTY